MAHHCSPVTTSPVTTLSQVSADRVCSTRVVFASTAVAVDTRPGVPQVIRCGPSGLRVVVLR
eukprot:1722579-Rhodomonas_salina.3